MKQFEYKVIPYEFVKTTVDIREGETLSDATKRVEEWLNSHGKEGWEFIGKVYDAYCFKREH